MTSGFCRFLDALGNVDDGVECVLNEDAVNRLMDIARDCYGNDAADFLFGLFGAKDDGSFTMIVEDAGSEFSRFLLT